MGLVLSLQKSGLTLAFASVHLGLSLDSDNFKAFWWISVDKAGLQCGGQLLRSTRPSLLHRCALTGLVTSFAGLLQGWAGRTQHRFSQQQSRRMLRSGHAVRINHRPLWIHYVNFIKCRNIPSSPTSTPSLC